MRSKCRCSCVLQFTCRRAICCVLHRPTSRVIHRSGLYVTTNQVIIKATSGYKKKREKGAANRLTLRGDRKSPFRGRANNSTGRTNESSNRCRGTRSPSTFRERSRNAGLWRPEPSRTPGLMPSRASSTYGVDIVGKERTSAGSSPPTVRPDFRVTGHQQAPNSLMILPQVHLRKPCYDFYFL